MKTKQTIIAIALSSLALTSGAVFADKYPTNPERDIIDESLATNPGSGGKIDLVGNANDGWKDVGGERGYQFVGGVSAPGGDAHAYTKEELMQARMDYRNSH